ncbi:NAD(P)-binding protein [Xylariaceae sp. FL0594]|nr:NAD(P)-binding protein [Xylariaceae sp. FL0594]
MPRLEGTILLTGANGGLGCGIVSNILSSPELERHYHGIYTVRDAAKPAPALDAVLQSRRRTSSGPDTPSHSSEKASLDLSRLASVRALAASINQRVSAGELPPIRAIILNAAYEEFQRQTWTDEGLDMTFVVNYLGHWLLVMLLLQSMDRKYGRVVWISSFSHKSTLIRSHCKSTHKTVISSDLEPIAKGTWSPNSADDNNSWTWAAGYRRYGASKLCGVTMIHELQRRLDRDPVLRDISVLAIDPGSMPTGIVRRSSSWFLRVVVFQLLFPVLCTLMVRLFPNGNWRTVQKSSRDVVAAALKSGPPPLSQRPKSLYLNGSELGRYNSEAADQAKGRVVWRGSVRYANLTEGDTVLKDWQ